MKRIKSWSISTRNRFYRRVICDSGDGCWLWAGAIANTGYGVMGINGYHTMTCHRVSWEIHNGAIPDGMMVLHVCDNRRCVNPNHLYLGDAKANARDLWLRGKPYAKIREILDNNPEFEAKRVASLPRGEAHHRSASKLTAEQAKEIFHATGSQRSIAQRYGIIQQAVSLIKTKKRWGWIHAAST